MPGIYTRQTDLPVSATEAFAWHERPGAFERLAPPWQKIRVIHRSGTIRDGDLLAMKLQAGPVALPWVASHTGYIPGRRFQDRQVRGPFSEWIHTHLFEPLTLGTSRLIDSIRFRLPLGPAGDLFGKGHMEQQLERLFDYRHRVTEEDLILHSRYWARPRLRVAVSGAGGLIGSALAAFLGTGGHTVVPVRRPGGGAPDEGPLWDPDRGVLQPSKMEGLDAVVHLAGENIGSLRWSADKMRRIRESRVHGTRSLVRSLMELDRPPRTLVCASAIGWYGDRGDEDLMEQSDAGSTFLADVAREWEEVAMAASSAGIRVVLARIGVVLDPRGGALQRLLPAFRLGMGGPIGNGRQVHSWISLDDVIGAIHHALQHDDLEGPVNLTAPFPATNREFTAALGRVLSRPAVLPLPAPVLRLVAGRMAEETVLASARVLPLRLLESGYRFRDPELEPALRWMLGRHRRAA